MHDPKLYLAIDRFLAQKDLRNAWLYGKYADAYLRHGYHSVNGHGLRTVDLANIVVKRQFRGQHVLIDLLAFLESKRVPLFVESVLEPRLQAFFEQRGYQKQETISPSYVYLPPMALGR